MKDPVVKALDEISYELRLMRRATEKPAQAMLSADELKYQISLHMLHKAAKNHDMTFEEYCAVYDSELHEQTLNKIMEVLW